MHDTDAVLEAELKHGGMLIREDDLEKDQLLCVHSIKDTPEAAPIMGQAFLVTAICLPYFTAKLVSNPQEVLTLDCRYVNLMRVTQDFAEAQRHLNGDLKSLATLP